MVQILGTPGPDSLQGNRFDPVDGSGNDVFGLGGNDTLRGGPGRDRLFGGRGDDLIFGSGNDHLYGGRGNDTLVASDDAGLDFLYGDRGDDILIGSRFGGTLMFGGKGNDTLYGVPDPLSGEFMFGDLGDDVIYSEGQSTLVGGGGATTPNVNDGNDTLVGGFGNQLMIGGTGDDTYLFQAAVRKQVAGRWVTEGGYGGEDVIRGFAAGPNAGDTIRLNSLQAGDVVRLTDTPGTGVVITIQGSVANTIIVEDVTLASLIAPDSNDVFVNGGVVNQNTGNLSGGTLTFTV